MSILTMTGHAPFFLIIGLSLILASASYAKHPRDLKSLEAGVSQAQLKKHDSAARSLDSAVKADPNNALAYLERAKIRQLMQQPLLALEDLRKVVELDPSDFSAWKFMGDVYLSFNQKQDALSCYTQAHNVDASEQVNPAMKSLIDHLRLGDGFTSDSGIDKWPLTVHEIGRVISKPVINKRPSPETVSGLVTIPEANSKKNNARLVDPQLSLDNLEESFAHFRRAVELQPNNAANHETLALIYQIMGKHHEAIKHYESVLKIFPNHVETMIALGDIYSLSLNDNKMALYWYAMAIKNEPDEAKKKSIADRVRKFMAGR